MNHIYLIKPLLGELCMTVQQGNKLYGLIYPQLIQGDTVTLDFIGVVICIPPFMNASVGMLLKDIPLEVMNKLLTITNLNPTAKQTFKLVIEDANEYWNDESIKKTVDELFSKLSKEGLR